jgi:hypothetical protein
MAEKPFDTGLLLFLKSVSELFDSARRNYPLSFQKHPTQIRYSPVICRLTFADFIRIKAEEGKIGLQSADVMYSIKYHDSKNGSSPQTSSSGSSLHSIS